MPENIYKVTSYKTVGYNEETDEAEEEFYDEEIFAESFDEAISKWRDLGRDAELYLIESPQGEKLFF